MRLDPVNNNIIMIHRNKQKIRGQFDSNQESYSGNSRREMAWGVKTFIFFISIEKLGEITFYKANV